MKDWIKKWLGIKEVETRCTMLELRLKHLDRRVGKLNARPLRYDEVERARKLANKRRFKDRATCV